MAGWWKNGIGASVAEEKDNSVPRMSDAYHRGWERSPSSRQLDFCCGHRLRTRRTGTCQEFACVSQGKGIRETQDKYFCITPEKILRRYTHKYKGTTPRFKQHDGCETGKTGKTVKNRLLLIQRSYFLLTPWNRMLLPTIRTNGWGRYTHHMFLRFVCTYRLKTG